MDQPAQLARVRQKLKQFADVNDKRGFHVLSLGHVARAVSTVQGYHLSVDLYVLGEDLSSAPIFLQLLVNLVSAPNTLCYSMDIV